jgi:hypothetical protein
MLDKPTKGVRHGHQQCPTCNGHERRALVGTPHERHKSQNGHKEENVEAMTLAEAPRGERGTDEREY